MSRTILIVFSVGVIFFLCLTAPSRPPGALLPPLNAEELDKYARIKQQVLDKNPALKAEDATLQSQDTSTDKQRDLAVGAHDEVRRALEDHDRKIMEEAIKIDPSAEDIYWRMPHQWNYLAEGQRDLLAYDSRSLLFKIRWHFMWEACSVFALGVGLFLLFRPPSYSVANLYFSLALLPAILAGPLALTDADWAYIWHLSGLYDGPTIPQILLVSHSDFMTAYLSSAACLVIYGAILFRIHRRQKNAV